MYRQEIFLKTCLCHFLASRRHLVESDSIEVIVLYNYWGIVVPQVGQISPGLQYYVDWEDETEKDIIQADIENYSYSEGDIK